MKIPSSVVAILSSLLAAVGVNSQAACARLPPDGHSISGVLTIVDDCTFTVSQFTQTPAGPDVYFVMGSTDGSRSELLSNGRRISDFKISGQYSNPTELTIKLQSGQSFDNFNVISIWCEAFKADFGQASLPSPTLPAPTSMPIDLINGYTNCLTLLKDRLNLYWNHPFANGSISMAMHASLESDRGWFAFGINNPSLSEISMIGADITLAGYDTKAAPSSSLIVPLLLLHATRTTSNIYTVAFLRPTTNTGNFHPLNVNSTAARLIWALGPIAEDASRPVVLFHKDARSSSNAPFNLAATTSASSSQACSPIVAQSSSPSTNTTTAPSASPLPSTLPYLLHGREGCLNQAEKIFAGGASSFGTPSKPFELKWTPDASTPDTLYYQCTTHQKLGWKIVVLNAPASGATLTSMSTLSILVVVLFALAF
ncbi:hypothetical protein BC829DRAFT_443747 [Chytridium lagenaria]|nr:hypothetical protein BC829DRAFT_443747 [Chytridium lagenaria]